MGILYRMLGVVALVNQRLSRFRINFIPLNWFAIAMLGAGLLGGVTSLVEYRGDGNPAGALATITIGVGAIGLLLALFVVTFVQQYVVFRKIATRVDPRAGAEAFPDGGIDLRVTGLLTLDARNSRRFLNVRASLVTLENGELAFISNINASSNFMGITVARRVGLWASIIQPGSLGAVELGRLYVGFAERPSLRLRYMDCTTLRPATTILSFATERERQILMQDLDRFAGHAVTGTMVR